ncbi:MAG: ABC transporter ATP-binding protein [Cytophagales bacterium]|nr:ABC transporter ATP-binding protein [Cytophagales bacterium]
MEPLNGKSIAFNHRHLSRPILRTQDLSIGYETKNGPFILEEHLNIRIHNGELVCLIGPNGCGKSTLMRTIAGLQKPLRGTTYIEGKILKSLPPHKYARLISLVLTDKIQAGAFSVKDVVAIGRYPYINHFAKLRPYDCKIIDRSLEMVHLESYSDRHFSELSDGEKQRVMIAKALAQDTPLIMLDEPTAHLDLPNRVEIMNILKKLAINTNKAILLSTHELDLALQTADSIWLMKRGTAIRNGAPEDLVLTGAFEDVFACDAFDFDKSTGAFKVKHISKGSVALLGSGIPYLWTRRALERDGYKISEGTGHEVSVKIVGSNCWQIASGGFQDNCKSIAMLLAHLRHLDYYKTKKAD